MEKSMLLEKGCFVVGCNYWASHAGTAMWSNWQPDVVEEDFRKLSDTGIGILRVFPLWPDFQPIKKLYTFQGKSYEIRIGEELMQEDEAGHAGISLQAVSHFEELVNMASKYGLKLIVSLITGWMSGRLFMPPALEGRNALTDPEAIMWEVRFVKYLIKRFLHSPSIIAWDLGNECNCIAEVPDRHSAWLWTSSIVNAVKSVDADRPVVSGMHSLSINGKWSINDQSELTDLLTTHPYPLFTPYCDQDPLNSIRTILHGTAETCYYRGIGGKACFIEEMGTLNPMMGDETVAASYLRANLFSAWAHECHGLLWWCNHDQHHLPHAPYDWSAGERELGLFRIDGEPKPVAGEFRRFNDFLRGLSFTKLPSRIVDGICLLSEGQDNWGAAYSTFILAKQAGFDIEFGYVEQPLKNADVYLLPGISGLNVISRHKWLELLQKVYQGAILYISCNDGLLTYFEQISGLKVTAREKRTSSSEFLWNDRKFVFNARMKLGTEPVSAKILGMEPDGSPVFTYNEYGKGRIYFLSFPVEILTADSPGAFRTQDAEPYWQIYRYIFNSTRNDRAVTKSSSLTGITEHPLNERQRVVILINYSQQSREEHLSLSDGWRVESWVYGNSGLYEADGKQVDIFIDANDAAIFLISR